MSTRDQLHTLGRRGVRGCRSRASVACPIALPETEDQQIRNVQRIRHIPCGDRAGAASVWVCPMRTAWKLHQAWPEAQFISCAAPGHSTFRTAATRHFRADSTASGSFQVALLCQVGRAIVIDSARPAPLINQASTRLSASCSGSRARGAEPEGVASRVHVARNMRSSDRRRAARPPARSVNNRRRCLFVVVAARVPAATGRDARHPRR